MTDIVERLRRRRLPIDVGQLTIYEDDKECHEAADEIERLRAIIDLQADEMARLNKDVEFLEGQVERLQDMLVEKK